MPVFDQLCQAARKAQEGNLISNQLAERVVTIGQKRLQYKHLGLELHGLVAQLAPVGGKGSDLEPAALEDQVQRIEARQRRL